MLDIVNQDGSKDHEAKFKNEAISHKQSVLSLKRKK
ncbi:hypothetical protein QG37_04822 [Candidozyma auris]|uniref:Uncharacterized protein n=1 Tax=Candidozyma auris TaxID=498019 RepID=A0A0L0NVV7_CANAR|nr:hypothetical protein QG37_04822 [[Candida] auris]